MKVLTNCITVFSKQNEYEYVTGLGLSSGFVAGGSSGGSVSLVASGGVFVAWVPCWDTGNYNVCDIQAYC